MAALRFHHHNKTTLKTTINQLFRERFPPLPYQHTHIHTRHSARMVKAYLIFGGVPIVLKRLVNWILSSIYGYFKFNSNAATECWHLLFVNRRLIQRWDVRMNCCFDCVARIHILKMVLRGGFVGSKRGAFRPRLNNPECWLLDYWLDMSSVRWRGQCSFI